MRNYLYFVLIFYQIKKIVTAFAKHGILKY